MTADVREARYDVAIIGFGPTGAIAAGLLGRQGIRTLVCDRLRDVYDKPRAIALDHEVTRVFQQMGLVDQIEPYLEPFTDSVYYGVDGQVIKRMSTVAPPYPLSHWPSVVFTQPPVERILRAHAQSHDSVQVRLGWTLAGLQHDADGARLDFVDDEGQPHEATARYVIGCDGASSTVRAMTGIGLEDLGFDEPWLVVDVLVNARGLARLPSTSVQYCNPERPATLVIGPGAHRRWEIALNPGEDPAEAATPQGTWLRLAPWLAPDEGTLWRQASYRFHALVAQRWREGPVFLAGDSAHQQPPFLGQGMCQGVRDAVNLCWRLTAVLKEGAADTLLDSYGPERKAHVSALTARIKGIGQIVTERDVTRARARDAQLLADCGGVVQPTPRQDVQPPLSCGLIGSLPHPARGTIFPQPRLRTPDGQEVRMDDLHPAGWKLVLGPEADEGFAKAARVHHLPALPILQLGSDALTETEGVLARWFATHGLAAALVRPDHYVYGVCRTPEDLAAQLESLVLR